MTRWPARPENWGLGSSSTQTGSLTTAKSGTENKKEVSWFLRLLFGLFWVVVHGSAPQKSPFGFCGNDTKKNNNTADGHHQRKMIPQQNDGEDTAKDGFQAHENGRMGRAGVLLGHCLKQECQEGTEQAQIDGVEPACGRDVSGQLAGKNDIDQRCQRCKAQLDNRQGYGVVIL